MWYECVGPGTELTQGDIISDCPVLRWKSSEVTARATEEPEELQAFVEAVKADVIIMTQACDLEEHKVDEIILCPHFNLDYHKTIWSDTMVARKQNPSDKSWKSHCENLCSGFYWNLAMLNTGEVDELKIAHRVVDFHEIFTVPRVFLESLLKHRSSPRLRLRAPYREHLSQAFARYFMRVGLPVNVQTGW